MARTTVAWGIDVGVTSLKAIKLRREAEGVAVEGFDVVEHDHFLSEPDVNRDETIRHTLQKFLERNLLRHEAVFIGVPGSSTFARFVKLPPVEPKKIPEIVRFEAMQQIPFPLEQVNWDYQTFSSPDTPEVEVGIFAMKKDLVTQVMANFQSSAMVVEGVQMSPLAVFNAVMYDDMMDGKGGIVVDIGAEHTDLIFVDSGRVWVRTINIGGNNFTDSLSKSFKVPFAKAEQLKRTAATSKYAKQIFQAMRPVFADLVAEIQRSKGFYDSSHRDAKLERIIGMGNPFKLPNLQKYIQQELKLEVVRLETFKKALVDGKLAAGLNEHILAMGGAFGLALQGLEMSTIDTNLLPMEIARQMLWRQKRVWFGAAAAMIVLGVGLSGYRILSQSSAFADSQKSPEAAQHTEKINEVSKFSSDYSAVPDTYSASKTQIDSVMNLSGDRKVWPLIYQDIVGSLPQAKTREGDVRGPRSQQKIIMITEISSTYTNNITSAASGASGVGVPTGGPDVPGGMGGMGGGGMGGAGMGGAGVGMPGVGMAGVSPTLATGGITPGATAPGFLLVITGYTPYAPSDNSGWKVIKAYADDLKKSAPKDATGKPDSIKPYYFADDPSATVGYTGSLLKSTAGNGAVNGKSPWDQGSHGSFIDALGTELLPTPERGSRRSSGRSGGPEGYGMGGTGGGGEFQPVGDTPSAIMSVRPIDPDRPMANMDNYFIFRIPLRVVLRNGSNAS